MKILFLNHNFEGFGTYFRCFHLAQALSRRGERVDLICASRRAFDLRIEKRMINPNFRLVTLPRIRFHPYHTGHTLRAVINSLLVVMRDYDILHSFAVAQPATAVPTVVARIFKNKPIVVDWDDIWEDGFGEYHPRLVRSAIAFLEKNVPKLSDRITVVSDYLKERAEMLKFPSEKIIKIINGADVEAIRPLAKKEARKRMGIENGGLIVLSIGHTYMGTLEILLDAYRLVREEIGDVKFFLVGSPGIQNDALVRAKKAALGNKMIFMGEKTQAEIPFLLGCADVLVLPMSNNVIEKARFPIRLGDYLSSGRPVVSNAVGEVRRVLAEGNCGLVSEPDDTAGFARQIVRLLRDGRLREELGRKARMVAVEQLSWEKVSQVLAGVYREVLS